MTDHVQDCRLLGKRNAVALGLATARRSAGVIGYCDMVWGRIPRLSTELWPYAGHRIENVA